MVADRRLLEYPSYQLLRSCVALLGAFAFGVGAVELCMGVPRSEGPTFPPFAERLPAAVPPLVVGVLCLVPFRWTLPGWVFWARMAAFVVIGAFVTLRGVQGVVLGLTGDRDPLIVPFGLFLILAGIGLPSALWWHRNLSRLSGF